MTLSLSVNGADYSRVGVLPEVMGVFLCTSPSFRIINLSAYCLATGIFVFDNAGRLNIAFLIMVA